MNLGHEIDSYDVVVRVNQVPLIEKAYWETYGSRTDVVYGYYSKESFCPESENFFNPDLKFISTCLPMREPFLEQNQKLIESVRKVKGDQYVVSRCDDQLFEGLIQKIGCRPYSGMAVVNELLHSELKELFIVGMTFYQGGLSKKYGGDSEKEYYRKEFVLGVHEPECQRVYLKELVKQDSRIRVDPVLHEILAGETIQNKQGFSLKRVLRKLFINKY